MNDAVRAAVERLVPHRGGMLWLERILACDGEGAVAEAVVREDHPFFDGGGVPAWVGIEYMAQCIAAWAGGQALAKGKPVSPGFLLGTRRYESQRPVLAVGTRLRIEARRELMGDNGLGMFACRILDGDQEIAVANVSVFEPPDPEAYLGNRTE
jgi:predicted hotdog family 3-hydroxylacyl-ACP dehydratase